MAEQTLNVFYHRIPNATFIFGDGSVAAFIGGRFTTVDPGKTAALDNEILAGNPHIYRDENQLTMTESELDPMYELRKKIIADYEAQKAVQDAGTADMGTSTQGPLNVTDSSDIKDAAANGTVAPAALSGLASVGK